MNWSTVAKPTTTWAATSAPTRGAAPDGFLADGTTDGFYAPARGDGLLTGDGSWTPVGVRSTAWTTTAKPT